MKFIVTALLGMLLLLVPLAASADVIPISDVNADRPDGLPNPDGDPVLYTEVVTVRGVVTVGTGALEEGKNEIYIQDDTGGVFVKQARSASPVVAVGDSVEVTGKVDVIEYRKTYLLVDSVLVPGSRIKRLSTGNPVPDPIELTPREIATNGEAYEGSRIVVRDVHLVFPSGWPSWG